MLRRTCRSTLFATKAKASARKWCKYESYWRAWFWIGIWEKVISKVNISFVSFRKNELRSATLLAQILTEFGQESVEYVNENMTGFGAVKWSTIMTQRCVKRRWMAKQLQTTSHGDSSKFQTSWVLNTVSLLLRKPRLQTRLQIELDLTGQNSYCSNKLHLIVACYILTSV